MKTTYVATLASGSWTYTKNGGAAVSGGSGDLSLPYEWMNDNKNQFSNSSISVEWSGMTGSGGSYKIKQTLESETNAAPALSSAYNITGASNATDINKHNYINELCAGIGVNIYKGSMTAIVVTVIIIIDDIYIK